MLLGAKGTFWDPSEFVSAGGSASGPESSGGGEEHRGSALR